MWLLENEVLKRVLRAEREGFTPTAEQQARFEAQDFSIDPLIVGDEARIPINGVLTNRPSFFASLFGGGNVTYPAIRKAVVEADNDPRVKSIKLMVGSSPGGHVEGLFDTIAALQAVKKPLSASVDDLAASATYALISQTDNITVKNRATRVGSIGVAVSYMVWPEDVDIASTHAPKKRPDVTTEEGKAIVREELDAIHELFADAVATGRKTTIDNVNAEFGQGAVLLADEALSRGMIDAIEKPRLSVVPNARSKTAEKGGEFLEALKMDEKTLQAQHPELYEAVLQKGVKQERDRVGAHLTFGENAGALDIAIGAIKDGSEMTQTLIAQYLTAGRNTQDVNNRQEDDSTTGELSGSAGDSDLDESDVVVAMVEKRCGVKGGK